MIYSIPEGIGFDPLHPDRVETQSVRQLGYLPLPGVPISPLASTDLTTSVRLDNQTTSYPGTDASAAQLATQAQQQSPPNVTRTITPCGGKPDPLASREVRTDPA
jgi:hypothetical protein